MATKTRRKGTGDWRDTYVPVTVARRLKTREKIDELRELLKDELPGGTCPVYLAIHTAIAEAIARRTV